MFCLTLAFRMGKPLTAKSGRLRTASGYGFSLSALLCRDWLLGFDWRLLLAASSGIFATLENSARPNVHKQNGTDHRLSSSVSAEEFARLPASTA